MTAFRVIESSVCNVDAEVAVVGAMLSERSLIDPIVDILKSEDFADPFLGDVFGLIAQQHEQGKTATPITLRPALEGMPAFADLGGWGWLAGLTGARASVIGAVDNARQVAEFGQRRRLIEGLREAITAAGDYGRPLGEVLEEAEAALSASTDHKDTGHEYSGAQCLDLLINSFGQSVHGVKCGNILSIDQLLGPMRPGRLIIGAGRPGMGKTATAISYALGAAAQGHGVLFISLEMGAEELAGRMAADLCLEDRVPYEAINGDTLTEQQRRYVMRARDRLANMPLQVIDKAGMTIGQLRTIVRRWKRRFAARGQKLELVIVDYLQLMRGGKGQDRYQAVTEISRSSKELAKEHDLAVFALCQLSRKVEERGDKRPHLSDLRESGQIEQDADAVLFFLRDEYYLRLAEPHQQDENRAKWESALEKAQGRIEFICAKRRDGRTGSLIGNFLAHFQAVRG